MKDVSLLNILKELDLTEYEAKALITLFKFSEADAPTISRNSEIPKTRIYDVLGKLKEKGLVLEVYAKPKTYKVINPNDIFKNLLEAKNKEFSELNQKVQDVLSKRNWNTQVLNTKEKILQINALKDYNKFLAQEFATAQKEICGFTQLDERIDSFKEIFNKNNLSIKILTRPMTKVFDLPKTVEVQEYDHSLDTFILDRKKVIMALNDLSIPKKTYHLTIQENNPSLANALLMHFNSYWKK
ncbi:MAG TPA: helix-turn-helix domain-containing protein [archaeon]|nr:helix-turn-helix domain-containing protein [archaeon]